MHTRHCPRHVFAAPPAHFSGVNVKRGRVVRGLYAAERTQGMAEGTGWTRTNTSEFREERGVDAREEEGERESVWVRVRERERETS